MFVRKMKNDELEASLKTHVTQERKLLHVILEHIKEIDRRQIYLERGYPSLYRYLLSECGYSGSAAMRRIEAVRFLRDVPELAQKIEDGSVNLSQIGEITRGIKEKEISGEKVSAKQKSLLLDLVANKTTQETQRHVSQVFDLKLKEPETTRVQKDESVHLTITLTKAQYEKLMRARDESAHLRGRDSSWAGVIEVLCDQKLRKFSTTASETVRVNKTMTRKTRRQIFRRDECCQYVDPKTGRKCASKYGLEVDHLQPRWAGGNHDPENLRLLCRSHNQYKYKKESGQHLANFFG